MHPGGRDSRPDSNFTGTGREGQACNRLGRILLSSMFAIQLIVSQSFTIAGSASPPSGVLAAVA